MPSEKQSNLPEILQQTLEELKAYNQQTGRHIKLEIEPGSYFVAAHGHIVSKVDDVVDT
jgi:diaminopimelate decarboxylase